MARKKIVSIKEAKRVASIFKRLGEVYTDVRCTLDYRSPFELLVMTILAAQCTDKRVNMVCQGLFKQYKNPRDFAEAAPGALESAIKPCGFFNQKARCIRETSRILIEKYGGQVPADMDALLQLPGVGRKIANAVLGESYHVPGVIVDTHCKRVANRLGFTKHEDPAKIEKDLMLLWPREQWTLYSHYMVFHGRAVCNARSPKCATCPVLSSCPWPEKTS
jgi:endonuclease III